MDDDFAQGAQSPALSSNVGERSRQQSSRRVEITPTERSIHFLRGVDSRSGIALASFYLILATDMKGSNASTITGYPGKVLQSALNFSSLNTVALACRKAFDHSISGSGLTGAQFGKQSDTTLDEHAAYWSKHSGRSFEEARQALHFLREVFRRCSKSIEMSRRDDALLCQRIGAVKEYANNAAAHLSLNGYLFDMLDLTHIVAALTLVAEIVRTFDRVDSVPSYFDDLDKAAHDAAVALFPDTPKIRLFGITKVSEHTRACRTLPIDVGVEMLLTHLPNVLGGPIAPSNKSIP